MNYLKFTATNLAQTVIRRPFSDKSNVTSTQTEAPKTKPVDPFRGPTSAVWPSNLERRFIVWMGKYKRIEDVPKTVPVELIEKARNRARIRIANIMMALTALACVGYAISGKRAAERGESVQKMNLDWHKSMAEKDGAAKK